MYPTPILLILTTLQVYDIFLLNILQQFSENCICMLTIQIFLTIFKVKI